MTELTTWQVDEVTKVDKKWALVPLDEVIVPVDRPEVPIPGVIYRQVGVKWWGLGVYEREAIDGSRTQYKTLSRIETDDIIINKIWARHGSVSVVQPSLAGCYVSAEFPLFVPNKERLHPQWFHWLTKTRQFWAQCDEKSRGTSGKNRIRPEQFLRILIPLPPLDEQRRIVARIEALAGRIEEGRGLRREAGEEAEQFWTTSLIHVFDDLLLRNQSICRLGDIARFINGRAFSEADWHGQGIPIVRIQNLHDPNAPFNYTETPVEAQFYINDGDLLVSWAGSLVSVDVFIWQRGFAYLNQHIFRVEEDPSQIRRKYLYFAIQQALGALRLKVVGATNQIHVRRGVLEDHRIPLPALAEQSRIISYLESLQEKTEALKQLQSDAAAELEALLPAVLDQAFRGEL